MGTSATSSSAAMLLICVASFDEHDLGQTEQRRDKRDAKRREDLARLTTPGQTNGLLCIRHDTQK
jgi:hypothetical protein